MVTKIFLGLAIACGIGAAVIGFVIVKPRIEGLQNDLSSTKTALSGEQAAHGKTKEELGTTKMALDTTKMELDTTKTSLAAKTSEAEGLSKDVSDLKGQVAKVTQERDTAKAENEEFVKFGHPMDEIKATFQKLPQVTKERDLYIAENKVLALDNKKKENQILDLLGGTPILPDNLTAKVVAVDPKYQFVVLNAGLDQGAKVNGRMVVNRDGKVIGEIKITKAEKEYSFANIIQGKTLLTDVEEGDMLTVSRFNNTQKKAQ